MRGGGGGECLDDVVGYPVAEVGHRRVVGASREGEDREVQLSTDLKKLGALHEASLTLDEASRATAEYL